MLNFVELTTPRDPAFAGLVDEIYAQREDLRRIYPDRDSPELHKWVLANGPLEYPDKLGRFFLPVPPEHLRETVCGGISEQQHLYSSVSDLETLLSIRDVFDDRPLEKIDSVLDFGCGCGRLLRWFPLILPEARCFGADVRASSIEWCRRNLPGTYFANDVQPPLPVESDSLDLIFSLSVFTHLDEPTSRAWLQELARICRPEGRIILSTHGAFSLAVTIRSPEHQASFRMSPDLARTMLRELQAEGFLFHRPTGLWAEKLEAAGEEYGMTFLTPDHVSRSWSSAVEVVGVVPAMLFLFQDLYVLRPRR